MSRATQGRCLWGDPAATGSAPMGTRQWTAWGAGGRGTAGPTYQTSSLHSQRMRRDVLCVSDYDAKAARKTGKRKGEAEGGRKRPRIELNPQIQAPVDEPHCAQKNREKRHSGQQPPGLDF